MLTVIQPLKHQIIILNLFKDFYNLLQISNQTWNVFYRITSMCYFLYIFIILQKFYDNLVF